MHGRLFELNQGLSSHRLARFVGIAVFFVAWVSYLGHFASKYGLNGPPSCTGDEASYDSLGWQLSRGLGFTVDYNDPQLRAPYDLAARTNPELFTLSGAKSGPITYRPPLFPLLIAGTNSIVGRQFWAVRVLNSAAIAATCALTAQFLFRSVGLLPAVIGAFTFVVIDYRTRLFGRAIMTEALACLLVALLALTLIKIIRYRKIRWSLLAGGLAGLAVLTRYIFVLWLPGLAMIIYFGCRSSASPVSKTIRGPFVHALLFIATATLVVMPWAIRNSIVLQSFKPLGTQGLSQLSAGYSDEALAHRGVWHNMQVEGFFDGVLKPEMSPVESELAMARYSSRHALEWTFRNPHKVLLLIPLKIFSEFRPYESSEAFVGFCALVGLAMTVQSLGGKVFFGLLLANAFAVAMTWSMSGRFLVPLLFVFHVFAAVGIWSILLMVTDARRKLAF